MLFGTGWSKSGPSIEAGIPAEVPVLSFVGFTVALRVVTCCGAFVSSRHSLPLPHPAPHTLPFPHPATHTLPSPWFSYPPHTLHPIHSPHLGSRTLPSPNSYPPLTLPSCPSLTVSHVFNSITISLTVTHTTHILIPATAHSHPPCCPHCPSVSSYAPMLSSTNQPPTWTTHAHGPLFSSSPL